MQYLCSYPHKHTHTQYLQYTLSSSLPKTSNTNDRACQPSIVRAMCCSGVPGTCMKIKKLGQLYLREEKSKVLHLSSLNAAMELQLCSHAGHFAIQPPSLAVHAFSFKQKNLFPSCLIPDNIRDFPAASELSQTVRSTWMQTLEVQSKKINSLPETNPFLSHAAWLWRNVTRFDKISVQIWEITCTLCPCIYCSVYSIYVP